MVEIRAFRGTFYDPGKVADLSRVVAPPYDVIDGNRKTQLLERSPYNIARIILPQNENDPEFWNSSASLFGEWKDRGVLAVDNERCLYIYRQTFDLPGARRVSRLGILTAIKCVDFSSGEILPHEKTFSRTRLERFNLLSACRANFSQVFMVFRDQRERAVSIMAEVLEGSPFVDFSDTEGVQHQLWRLEDGSKARELLATVGQSKVIIADGHHRYETALIYGRENRRAGVADDPGGYVSAVLFRSEDPGLAILPVHRMLRRLPTTVEEAYRCLERYFRVEVIQEDIGIREGMFGDRLEGLGRTGFVMLTRRGAALLVLREGLEPSSDIRGPQSDRWKGLDISILHSLALGEALGLDADRLAEDGELTFTPWESKALDDLTGGKAEAVFLVRPTSMQEIWSIAEGSERMPHKSSYFYPKLPSGLVIFDHETAFSRASLDDG